MREIERAQLLARVAEGARWGCTCARPAGTPPGTSPGRCRSRATSSPSVLAGLPADTAVLASCRGGYGVLSYDAVRLLAARGPGDPAGRRDARVAPGRLVCRHRTRRLTNPAQRTPEHGGVAQRLVVGAGWPVGGVEGGAGRESCACGFTHCSRPGYFVGVATGESEACGTHPRGGSPGGGVPLRLVVEMTVPEQHRRARARGGRSPTTTTGPTTPCAP